MLKIVLASLGVTIDQDMIDVMMKDGLAAIQAVKEMKASQDRCEAMLKEIMQVRERAFSATVKSYVDSQGCAHDQVR
jgi:hypothetical protein